MPQRRLDGRLEEVVKAVGDGWLQMPLSLAPAVRETVAGHRLGALEGGGTPPPFQCIPGLAPCTTEAIVRMCGGGGGGQDQPVRNGVAPADAERWSSASPSDLPSLPCNRWPAVGLPKLSGPCRTSGPSNGAAKPRRQSCRHRPFADSAIPHGGHGRDALEGGGSPPPPPPCDIPSGCCFFTGPWTVTRSPLRVLRRVAAFCRPLRPVLLLVVCPRSRSAVIGVPGLCWLRRVPFVR